CFLYLVAIFKQSCLADRVGKIAWAIKHITIQVRVPTSETNRILAYPASIRWRVVSRSIELQRDLAVPFAGRELKPVAIARTAFEQDVSIGVIRQRIEHGAARVGELADRAELVGQIPARRAGGVLREKLVDRISVQIAVGQ